MNINAYVQFAPLPTMLGTMLFAFLLAFTQKLNSCGVHQQVQSRLAACVRHLHIQIKLSPAQRAEVGHWPGKAAQLQYRLHQACGLPEC